MSQTTTLTQSQPEAAPDPAQPFDSRSLLLNLIVTLLAPMFLCAAAGDIALARMAAAETVNAYGARDHVSLLAVAQIIAFGLATLGALSLSMADDIPVSMTLRLYGNANALNRSAERNRRAMKQTRSESAAPQQIAAHPEIPTIQEDSDPPDTDVFLSLDAAKLLVAESEARLQDAEPPALQAAIPASNNPPVTPTPVSERRHEEMWAIAMVKEAGEINASIANLPPAERKAASLRASVLSSTASQLLAGSASPGRGSSPIIPPPAT